MKFNRVEDWLAWQEGLHSLGIDLGLERVAAVAERCGLLTVDCPVITVVGTNGKGSTVAFMESMFRAEGYRVASYTSPHLRRYNERIKVNGKFVSDEALCRIFDFIDKKRHGITLSFFEFGTLAALCYFRKEEPDVMILEAGLGGRLDAVNIVSSDVAVIASIDVDHTSYLGDSRDSIAIEKAGVMRCGKPLICGDLSPPDAIKIAAREGGANLLQLGKDFNFARRVKTWDFVCEDSEIVGLPEPSLFGSAQYRNAACAIQALRCISKRLPVSRLSMEKGLSAVNLRGRFEFTYEGCAIIRDIAHNPASCFVLAENLRAFKQWRRVYAIFGVLDDKDAAGMVEALLPLVDVWLLGQPDDQRAMAVEKLADIARSMVPEERALTFQRVGDAYRYGVSCPGLEDVLVIFGSVVTVAETMFAASAAVNRQVS